MGSETSDLGRSSWLIPVQLKFRQPDFISFTMRYSGPAPEYFWLNPKNCIQDLQSRKKTEETVSLRGMISYICFTQRTSSRSSFLTSSETY